MGMLNLATFACAAGLLAASLQAQPPSLLIPRTDTPPRIDGRLDDPAWSHAAPRYATRVAGLMPMYGSVVRVAWDASALYVGFQAEDSDVRSELDQRDAAIWEQGDCFEMFLLGPHAESLRIELQLSPRGAFLDMLHTPDQTFDQRKQWTWAGVEFAAQTDGALNAPEPDRGWSGELKLPWSALSELWGDWKPQAGAEMALLFMFVNRNDLAPGLGVREQTFWPAPDAPRVSRRSDFTAARLVERPAQAMSEGFSRFVQGHRRRSDVYLQDYRGLADYREFDNQLPDARLVWQTGAAPANPGPTVQFALVGQTLAGSPQAAERAEFELWLNDQLLLRFTPFQQQDTSWTGPQAKLEFRHRAGQWQPSGLFVLTVPSALLAAGQPATLEVRRRHDQPRTTFLIKGWPDAAQADALTPP